MKSLRLPGRFILNPVLLCILPCMFLFQSCEPGDNGNNGNDLPKKTQLIDSADFQKFFYSLDSATYTLKMDPAVAGEYDIKPGNIILSDRGRGLLRKVVTVKTIDNELVLTTEPASLAEAIKNGHLEFTRNLGQSFTPESIIAQDPGVTLLPALKGTSDGAMSFSLEVNLASNLKIKGELTINPSISAEMDIEYSSLNYLKVEFRLEEEFELTAITTLAEYQLEKEKSILTVRFPPFTVMAGPVPVVVTPEFEIKVGVNLELKSELSVSAIQDLVLTAGLEYDDGWNPFYSEEHSFGRNGPVLTNTAEAKVYVKPQINMMIYNVVSPNLSTELYGLVEAELGKTPWWSLFAGLSGNIGCDVTVLDYDLASFEGELFDLRFLVAEASSTGNDPPLADFTVEPDSGDVTTNFQFNASGCRDIQDAPSLLQVRWDWEGDGIFDKDFATAKQSSHLYPAPGLYQPVLEVRDRDGNIASATKEIKVRAVPNRKPKALFSVDPPTGAHYDRFTFDAGGCTDPETGSGDLLVQWDWDSDGNYDTPYSRAKVIDQTFFTGTHLITLRVADEEGYVDTETKTLVVFRGNPTGILVDERDNRSYKTVTIGTQTWMAENLNVGTMINGSTTVADNNNIEKWCYEDDPKNCETYGGLYDWYEMMEYSTDPGIRGICPAGWHIPTVDEWQVLIEYLGGTTKAGIKLKEAGIRHWPESRVHATNESGFTALPGGWCQNEGKEAGLYYDILHSAYFWTSTVQSEDHNDYHGWNYHILNGGEPIIRGTANRFIGLSIRCIKNN